MISRSKKTYNRQDVVRGPGNETPDVVVSRELKDIPITTRFYTAEDIDEILSQLIIIGKDGIIIPDRDIIGDYYSISMRSGRLSIEKVDGPNG